MRRPGRGVFEYIRRDPANRAILRARLRRDRDGVGIEIDAGELHGISSLARPGFDAAQAISIAATHVENSQRSRSRPLYAVKPVERGAVAKKPAIHSRQIA